MVGGGWRSDDVHKTCADHHRGCEVATCHYKSKVSGTYPEEGFDARAVLDCFNVQSAKCNRLLETLSKQSARVGFLSFFGGLPLGP